MTTPSAPLPARARVSASSLKALTSCSLAFYYERILKLPTKEWAKTTVGLLVHSLFECLRNPRHRKHYDAIVMDAKRVDYTLSPAVYRLVRMWVAKHQLTPDLLLDLNVMLWVGLVLTDFHWTGADKDPITGAPLIYGPEHEFKLTLPDGTVIKGYIDDMAQVNGIMQIRDWKSYGKRQTADELPNSIQAAIYQLYVWQAFGLPAEVHFVALRHPPTSRTPMKHLQIVEPASATHLAGLVEWVQSMAGRVAQFSLDDALISPMDDFGFCRNVCTHYAPHPYWVVCRADDPQGLTPISSHLSLDKASQACEDGGIVLERHHPGCMVKWNG